MRVTLEWDGRPRTVRYTGPASGLLSRLRLNPAAVLVARNGVLVPLDARLKTTDTILILSVVSGG